MEEKNTNLENLSNEVPSTDSNDNALSSNLDGGTSVPSDTIARPTTTEEVPLKAPPAPKVTYRWEYAEQRRNDGYRSGKAKKNNGFLYIAVFALVFLLTIFLLVGALFLGTRFDTLNDEIISDETTAPPTESTTTPNTQNNLPASPQHKSLGDLYEECLPSYVAISVTTLLGEGTGSGIIITSDGYIATNYHVVQDALSITVLMSDGTKHTAELIDGDSLNDVAVIKVDAKNLPAARIGSSENSKVGDQVMAIGTPHSIDYHSTMTSGYISALNRRYVEKNTNGSVSRVLYLIQTDTSVNPGNSGGPLFNMDGEVIGIVTLKISGSNYEGLGFALPIESVIDMINDIIQNGKITDPNAGGANQGAALGVSGFAVAKDTKYLLSGNSHFRMDIDPTTNEELVVIPFTFDDLRVPLSETETLEDLGITDYTFYTAGATGVVIKSTTAGFDSANKLKVDDIIVSADGISCELMSTLQYFIAGKNIGEEVVFEVFRDGELISVTVILGASADMD